MENDFIGSSVKSDGRSGGADCFTIDVDIGRGLFFAYSFVNY